jgi:hypothetical protein
MRQTMLILCDFPTEELNVKGSNLKIETHSYNDISLHGFSC